MHINDQLIDDFKKFVDLEYATTLEVQNTLHVYMMLTMWLIKVNQQIWKKLMLLVKTFNHCLCYINLLHLDVFQCTFPINLHHNI